MWASLLKDSFEEKNSFRYSLGQYELENFSLISAIPNEQKETAIIFYYKNKILSKIEFDFMKGLSNPSSAINDVNLIDEYWKDETEMMGQTKEAIFSSRLYWVYCKSYMIFYNSNFTLFNKGFISHDSKCANLLSYSKFFEDNKFSLNIDSLNNTNQILIQRKRKLDATSTPVPEKCNNAEGAGVGYTQDSISFNLSTFILYDGSFCNAISACFNFSLTLPDKYSSLDTYLSSFGILNIIPSKSFIISSLDLSVKLLI